MATAKKAATKKAAAKKSTRKVAVKKVAGLPRKIAVKKVPVETVDVAQADLDLLDGKEVAPVAKKPRVARKTAGRKKGKAGRKAAQEFLYSIRSRPSSDDGLDDEPVATSFVYVGPFASEAEATSAALEEVGGKKDIEIVVFRDFRRGTPETKVRLVS